MKKKLLIFDNCLSEHQKHVCSARHPKLSSQRLSNIAISAPLFENIFVSNWKSAHEGYLIPSNERRETVRSYRERLSGHQVHGKEL